MENFYNSLQIVAPVFIIIAVGSLLKFSGVIDKHFIKQTSTLVFRITLPCLIFNKISTTDYQKVVNFDQIVFALLGTTGFIFFIWVIAHFLDRNGANQGAFIQGGFRSNFSILGFALIQSALGDDALANAAILLAFMMPFFNISSIIVLTIPLHREKNLKLEQTLVDILTNPLLLAVLISFPFSYFRISVHPVLHNTLLLLGSVTLPLALLAIGGSLSFIGLKQNIKLSFTATVIKILIMPAVLITLAIKMGLRGQELGVLFFLFSAPTAIVSYVMAEALGSNPKLAADIIFLTTAGSILSISIGIFLLKSLGFL